MSSFIIAVVVGGLDVVLGVMVVLRVAGAKEASEAKDSMLAGGLAMVCLNCLSIPLCLAGVGLAIAALIAHKDRSHLLTYIGLTVNALVILTILGLYLFGSLSRG